MELALLVLSASLAFSQSFDVTLNGTVTDETGAVVPAVSVRAVNTQTGFPRETLTSGDGSFILLNLPAGTYRIEAFKPGFARAIRNDQVFVVGTTMTVDFALQLASVTQTVEVSGNTPVIQTTRNVLARTVEFSEIDTLPVINRSFADLAALAPGVVRFVSGSVAITGSRTFQNSYLVDGLSAEKHYDGLQRVGYAQDWIQEFQVMTSQYAAEFGQVSGGVLNAITRSGTNALHGRVYGFLRNDAWEVIPEFTTTKPPLDEKRIGATLGGPLKKDRLFYFLGYEWFNNQSSSIVNTPFTPLRARKGIR